MTSDQTALEEAKLNRLVQVTVARESVPSDPTQFDPKALGTSQVVITDLRIEFKVTHTLRTNPNQCDITITNLAPDSRAFMDTRPLVVQLAAGYEQTGMSLLFSGDVIFSMTELKSPDWKTLLQLGDGSCNNSWARVNKSYKAGTTYRQVISDCTTAFGFSVPKTLASNSVLNQVVPGGAQLHGRAANEFTRLLQPLGLSWSIQGGRLVVLSDTEALPGFAHPVDTQHGMIGTPDYTQPPRSGKAPHIRVKMLLRPEIHVGGLVQLTSITKSGTFRVEKVIHEGCNLDGEFTTEIEIQPMQATTDTEDVVTPAMTPAAASPAELQDIAEVAGFSFDPEAF